MVDSTLRDQSYGHFGTPVYDIQSKRWIFGRSAINSWYYRPLGDVKRTVAGTKDVGEVRKEAEGLDKASGRALAKEIRLVVQGNPELQAAEDILNPLIRASEAVTAAVATYDPACGDILALGTAAISDGQNRHHKTWLLAIPGGGCGEMLRLVRLETAIYGWDEHEARLMVPSPSEEIGHWIGRGAPVQQICTPEMLSQEDAGRFFAVRLPGTTLLFRPRYRATPVPPAGVYPGCTIPPSRVDANFLLEVLPKDWQGQQHSDITFNPWNQQRLAIVDQAGDWAIFTLQQKHKSRQAYIHKLGHRGSLEGFLEDSKTREDISSAQQDGWARILWVADKNTLLVCTRRRFQLFSLSAETTLPFPTPVSHGQWILDVRRCPSVPTWVFILTSSQVLWLEILPEIDRGTDITVVTGKILLSAHHFRDSSDISLQMRIEHDLNVISILLWSPSSPLVTCLRFDRQQSITGSPSIIGSPTGLLLPIPGKDRSLPTAAISVRQLSHGAEDETAEQPILHSLLLLTTDLALHHAFLGRSDVSFHLHAPRIIISSRTHPKITPLAVDEDDDFIVPDELSQKKRTPCVVEKPPSHKIKYRGDDKAGNTNYVETNSRVDNQIVSSKISGKSKLENRQEIVDIANSLQNLILDEDVLGLGEPAKTLLEQSLNHVPEVGDLSETTQVISDLLSLSRPGPVPDEPGVAVKKLQVPAWASPMGVASDDLEFGSLYNHIVDHQLAPLADEIPPRLRMGREKFARQIAAELMLSGSRVEVVDRSEEPQEQAETKQSLLLYSKGKGKLTDSYPVSSQISEYMSSQNLPTPSPSASRAASTIMSGTTTSLPSAVSQSIISRLSRHVEFEPPSTWAKRPMALLAHWDIGQDPNTYSYTQKLGELEKQKQEESMTDKQRAKAREKAERRLKRQRREAEKARGALMSSQPMVMSSQAHRGGSQFGGSQYGGGSQFGGSQHGRSSPPLRSSPPAVLDRERERNFAMSSQLVAPPMVGSSQAPVRRGDGPAKKKKRKREGF
ncbi:RNA polymerase I-specific transcription initiation factor RRN6-like protein [Venturia nashicola]|nr:RNA polymerase I-specific transcription initiation factor RRN6-like protein [Venturia nashicola]